MDLLERSHTSSPRWLAPPAQDVASYALVCLLRAAEVDVCGLKEIDSLDTGGRELDIDTAGGGRAIVMEEGVLLLVLRACAMFQDHDGVVKACCMLMRVGVQCSLSGGEPKVRPGLTSMYLVFIMFSATPLQRGQCFVASLPRLPLFSISLAVSSVVAGGNEGLLNTVATFPIHDHGRTDKKLVAVSVRP